MQDACPEQGIRQAEAHPALGSLRHQGKATLTLWGVDPSYCCTMVDPTYQEEAPDKKELERRIRQREGVKGGENFLLKL